MFLNAIKKTLADKIPNEKKRLELKLKLIKTKPKNCIFKNAILNHTYEDGTYIPAWRWSECFHRTAHRPARCAWRTAPGGRGLGCRPPSSPLSASRWTRLACCSEAAGPRIAIATDEEEEEEEEDDDEGDVDEEDDPKWMQIMVMGETQWLHL